MKIAHAQLQMYTNIMYKFQSSTYQTVGEKLQTKFCPQKDGRTAMAIPVYPLHFVVGGYKNVGKDHYSGNQHYLLFPTVFLSISKTNCII